MSTATGRPPLTGRPQIVVRPTPELSPSRGTAMPADQRLKDALRLIIEDREGKDPGPGNERWFGTAAVHPYNWEELGYAEYFYRRDTLLVRTEDVELVLRALREEPAEREKE